MKDPPSTTKPAPGPVRLAVLSIVFLVVVIATVVYHDTFFIPIFLGLIALTKTFLKSITPKLILLFLKNSLVIKIRQLITRASANLLVMSHRPIRLKIRAMQQRLGKMAVGILHRYLNAKLWIRTAIALGLLVLTASSSYVFIALLIIPQPLVNWLKKLALNTLNKLGITQALNAIWRFLVPTSWQNRWRIYKKWTLGRRQIKAARVMHRNIADTHVALRGQAGERSATAGDNDKNSTDFT